MSNLKEYAAATSSAKSKSADAFRMYIFDNSFYSYNPKKLVAVFQKKSQPPLLSIFCYAYLDFDKPKRQAAVFSVNFQPAKRNQLGNASQRPFPTIKIRI